MNKDLKLKIKNYKDFFLDLIYPKYCVGCSEEGAWLCEKCRQEIIIIRKPFCPTCNKLTPKGQFCSNCRNKTNLTGVIIAAYYKEGPIKEAIHTFKYDGIFDLSDKLGKILIEALNIRKINGNYILMPVPLHSIRYNQRGFNQSELLSNVVSEKFSNFLLSTQQLIRIKQSAHQVDLNREQRISNAKNQFDWCGKANELIAKKIILVDDVYTTGATLNECAKILREKAGAREVWGLVVAKH